MIQKILLREVKLRCWNSWKKAVRIRAAHGRANPTVLVSFNKTFISFFVFYFILVFILLFFSCLCLHTFNFFFFSFHYLTTCLPAWTIFFHQFTHIIICFVPYPILFFHFLVFELISRIYLILSIIKVLKGLVICLLCGT